MKRDSDEVWVEMITKHRLKALTEFQRRIDEDNRRRSEIKTKEDNDNEDLYLREIATKAVNNFMWRGESKWKISCGRDEMDAFYVGPIGNPINIPLRYHYIFEELTSRLSPYGFKIFFRNDEENNLMFISLKLPPTKKI